MRQCSICERGYLSTVSRSHSHIRTLRRQKVNLQKRVIDGARALICASCLKARKFQEKVKG